MEKISPEQLIERANEWLIEKGEGPLNSQEVVYITKRMMDITDECNGIRQLNRELAMCVSKFVCELRGYRVPPEEELEMTRQELIVLGL